MLFYQDFKDTFVCNTQLLVYWYSMRLCCFIRISKILLYAIHNISSYMKGIDVVVLSGFQRYFCMQYTTYKCKECGYTCCFIRISKILLYAIHNETRTRTVKRWLFYQDFKDTFVCNTQPSLCRTRWNQRCFIRISKILLYAIHNTVVVCQVITCVVLSGFQRYFCMQYTTQYLQENLGKLLFYQDFKDTFVCNTQRK